MALETMPLDAFLNQRGRKPTTNPNRYSTQMNIPTRALTELVLSVGGQVEIGAITVPTIKPMPYSFDYACWELGQFVTEQYYLNQAMREDSHEQAYFS